MRLFLPFTRLQWEEILIFVEHKQAAFLLLLSTVAKIESC